MSDKSILRLFEGLKPEEATLFRARLLADAQAIRDSIRPAPDERGKERKVSMATKASDLKMIDKRLSELEARRTELQLEEHAAREAIKAEAASLSASLLNKAATGQSVQVLSGERVRIDGLKEAVVLADSQLSDLRKQRAGVEYDLAVAEYEDSTADVGRILVGCFKLLYQVIEQRAAISPLKPPRGYTPSAETRAIRDMVQQLDEVNVRKKLYAFEEMAPGLMKQASQIGVHESEAKGDSNGQ